MRPHFCVIMPWISRTEAELRKTALTEVSEKLGIDVNFPEYRKNISYFNIQETIERFIKASFVLVDLSFERPSCYYELGIAESIGAKVVLFALQGTPIHQTSHHTEVRFYENMQQFKSLFEKTYYTTLI